MIKMMVETENGMKLMINNIDDVEAYIQALLDITDKDYYQAIRIVCNDIEIKERNHDIL